MKIIEGVTFQINSVTFIYDGVDSIRLYMIQYYSMYYNSVPQFELQSKMKTTKDLKNNSANTISKLENKKVILFLFYTSFEQQC